MPIANIQDAREVEDSLRNILAASGADATSASIRTLLVETLDFDYADRLVPLNSTHTNLPSDARLLARRDGVSALYIPLDDADGNQVTGAVASAAAKVIGDTIADEPLVMFTNRDRDQLHVIYPDLSGNRPALQRMVAHRDQPRRTVVQQIANLWHDYGVLGKPLGEAVRNAFNVQPVTNAFFKDYKAAYDDAVALLSDQLERQDAEQFTQTLFNRLLFTHFVSRKGWLKFNGDTDYLNALWADYRADGRQANFYAGRLHCLFFDGLNNPDGRDLTDGLSPLIGEVPFLNGGLFEETDLDRRAVNAVPDAAIAPLLGDGNNPGLFNRYNFTVTESTPLDTEVAVDPEMLGKLFEETVNERQSNGTYYTPRPVVAFMCREAIKGYLSGKNIDGLDDAKIADLVDNRNPDAITPMQAPAIYEAVKNLKALDPACGSGAFLLGMLQEILALNDSLFRAGHTAESLYRQKLDIIINNIYGADKDTLAVSTAMLRLWLSLAVDFDSDGTPDPLPNLDLKLMVGDSIAGPDPRMVTNSTSAPESQQMDFTTSGIDDSDLRGNIAAYTNAQGQSKAALKATVEAIKANLRRRIPGAAPAGVVEWRIDFADVMLNGGFDVVIANPPYVQLQRNGGELANLYRNVGYATFARTGDIYQLFFERGCQLLNSAHGILAYITSNSWLKAEYGKATRRYLAERHTPTLLLEMGKDVFDEAIVDTSVLLLRQKPSDNRDGMAVRAVDIDHLEDSLFPPPAEQWGLTRPNGDAPWSILSKTEQSIMDKMMAVGTPLKEWDIAIYRGITTGLNEAFIIDNRTKEALVNADPKSAEILKPVVRGRDIRRYRAQWASLWLIDTHNGHGDTPAINIDDFPAVKAHLDGYYPRLAKRYDKGTTPYNLRNCAYHADFAGEKLFWMDLTDTGRFAYEDGERFCLNTVFMMTGQALKYHCAVLNSKLVTWFMSHTALNSGMGVTRWIGHTVEQIPVLDATDEQRDLLVRQVNQVLEQKAADPATDTKSHEDEINRLVYTMYGLTDDEIAAVDEGYQAA